MTNDDFTSILDKTDWRKTIHKALEEAVMSIGQGEPFFYNVEQAIAAIQAVYPNWDATKEINLGLKKIIEKHNLKAQIWIDAHKIDWAYPWIKALKTLDWQTEMYMEILQFLKDVAGKHRMLLWGVKSVPEGSIGPEDTNVSDDKVNS